MPLQERIGCLSFGSMSYSLLLSSDSAFSFMVRQVLAATRSGGPLFLLSIQRADPGPEGPIFLPYILCLFFCISTPSPYA